MPQLQLPIFPEGSENLSPEVAVVSKDGKVVYFNGQIPFFTHDTTDLASFRLITSQLMNNGQVTQSMIARTFSVPLRSVKRHLNRFRDDGAKAFFTPPVKREGQKLSAERLKQVQGMLNQGLEVPQISREVEVLPSTLHKALKDGRLTKVKKKSRR